jgi:hypothetical protein
LGGWMPFSARSRDWAVSASIFDPSAAMRRT